MMRRVFLRRRFTAIAIAFCALWSTVVVIWAVQGVLSPIAAEGIVGDVARNKADYFGPNELMNRISLLRRMRSR